jgi:hypothetical protein
MEIRKLSHDQLKDLKKELKRSNRKFLFFKRDANPHNGHISLAQVRDEIIRRKVEKLKLGKQKVSYIHK